MSSTPDRILNLREEKNITRAELARKVGVSKTTIQKWEEGLTSPRRDKIVILSQIFNVDEAYLLGIQDEPIQRKTINIKLEKTYLTDDDLQIFKKLDSIREKYDVDKNGKIDLSNEVAALVEENTILKDFAEKAIKQHKSDMDYILQLTKDNLKKTK